jgi:hypothetical protein
MIYCDVVINVDFTINSYSFIADVVVHRLLAAALDIAKLPPVFQDGPQLTGITDSKNQMHH